MKTKSAILVAAITLLCGIGPVWALPAELPGGSSAPVHRDFFQQHAQGWFWYKDAHPNKKQALRNPNSPVGVDADPVARLHALQKRLAEYKDLAVLDPTTEHVRNYMYLQKYIVGLSTKFSDIWRRVVWQTPQLNYSLKVPTNTEAKQTYYDQRQIKIAKAVERAGHKYGIFFFFRSNCPYCHRFAPIMREFQETFNIPVVPVSLDGGGLPQYPNPETNVAAAQRLHVNVVPSVYLVNPRTQKVVVVTHGLISLSQLEQRIYILTSTVPGQDY